MAQRQHFRASFLLYAIALVFAHPATSRAEAIQALSAAKFLDSIGVVVHFPPEAPNGTSYDNTDVVIRELSTIGVTHVRGGIDNDASILARMRRMTDRLGIKWDLLYERYKGGTTALLEANVKADQVLGRSVEAFEGPNEPDWFGLQFDGGSGGKAVRLAQKALYDTVRRNPVFATVPVYGPALSYPARGGLERAIGDLSAYSDAGSVHIYVGNSSLGKHLTYDFLKLWGSFGPATIAVDRPRVITEAGWTTRAGAPEGVDESTQAKYMLEYLLDAFSQGFSRVYLYELAEGELDPQNKNSEMHFGLFRVDGTPKPAATALATLKTLLTGSDSILRKFSYTVTGLPLSTGHHLLLDKGDGTFVIALWNEAYLWDEKKQARIPTPDINLEVKLASPASSIKIVDPLAGTSPLQTLDNTSSVSVTLPDHPVFVFVSSPR